MRLRSGIWLAGATTIATILLTVGIVPSHVQPGVISGGDVGVLAAAACTICFVWLRALSTGVATLDTFALWLVFLALSLFEHNFLIHLVPLVAALAWLAWRYARSDGLNVGVAINQRVLIGMLLLLGIVHVVALAGMTVADVGQASVFGANAILHGNAPYGDPQTVSVLGDTYGPYVYLLYVPAAALLHTAAAARTMALLGHLILGFIVFAAGRKLAPRGGLVALALWMAIPASTYTLSVSAHDEWVAAAVIASAVAATPLISGLILGVAAGAKVFPAILLPLWLARRPAFRDQLLLLVGFSAAIGAGVAAIAVIEPSAVGTLFDKVLANQGLRYGVHLWNVPLDKWRLDLPYNFWGLWGDQQPALHLLAKVGVIGAALWIARSMRGVADLRLRLLRGSAIMCLLLLVLNNLSWNYVSWLLPLVAVAIVPSGSARVADE